MEPGYVDRSSLQKAFIDSTDSRVLNLILFVTEQCNFRCTYCYETFTRGAMPPATLLSIERLLERRAATLKNISINWFGGEPLLAWRSVLHFSRRLQHFCKINDITREDSMTTNGALLTSDIARQLIDSDIRVFQISLDGPKRFHDTTRLTRRGNGTYDKILAHLHALRDVNARFQVALRVHVNGSNCESIPDFVSMLDDAFGADDRFGIHIVPVEKYNYGLSASFSDCASRNQYQSCLIEARKRVVRSRILNENERQCYICYASKANSLVIRSDGKILKCTVAVDDARNHVGDLMPDGSIVVDQDRFRWWLKGFSKFDTERLACPNSFSE